MNRQIARGFTLIEMMVVMAIVGIVSALALSAYSGIGERAAPQNAAYDLSAAMARGRARALEKNGNVWVIIYPNASAKPGVEGGGAWAMVDDVDLTFSLAASSNTHPSTIAVTGNNRLLETKYFDDYAQKNVKFDIPVHNTAAESSLKLGPPFATSTTTSPTAGGTNTTQLDGTQRDSSTVAGVKDQLVTSGDGCTFCGGSGTTRRGAVVFTPEGSARFVNDTSAVSIASGPGFVTMTDASGSKRSFVFAVFRASSYIGFYSN